MTPQRIRLVAWNILHGGGPSRLPEIALALHRLAPDIVVLSEFRNIRGGQLRATLADAGLEHQLSSHTPAERGQRSGPSNRPRARRSSHEARNAVFIASRYHLIHVPPPPDLGTRFLHVRVGDVEICGVHVPDDTDHTAKSRFWQALLTIARGATDRRLVILGDFNTGRHWQDGPKFGCEALLGNLLSLGFVDAWRNTHPFGREDTWTSSLGRGRIDTTYLSPLLADTIISCEYEHAVREAGFSDHSAVVTDLAAGRPASETPPNGLFLT